MARTDRMKFSPAERRGLYRAIYERRDIRSHFLPLPVADRVLGRLLDAAHHGPSVGFMQPWDFIVIRNASVRHSSGLAQQSAISGVLYKGMFEQISGVRRQALPEQQT